MGKKKKGASSEELNFVSNLKGETVGLIIAIALFALALFFILASIHRAGFVGEKSFSLFQYLFGIGYFLIPLLLILLGISFAKAEFKPVGKVQLIAITLFFTASLGLLNFILPN